MTENGDVIYPYSGSYVLFNYNEGDGFDTIQGFNATSTLQIGDGTSSYSKSVEDNDILVTVKDETITLRGAASLSAVNIKGTYKHPLLITLTEGNDKLKTTLDGATVQALGGNDSIRNQGDNVTITGGAGNDTLRNQGDNVLFNYANGDGNDLIYGFNESSTLRIADGTGTYSNVKSGKNIIVTAGSGKITLAGAATLDTLNIVGTKKTYKTLSLTDKSSDKLTLPSTYIAASGSKRTKAIQITGNSLDNTITGGTGKDVICGFDNDDMLQITGDRTALITSKGAVSFKVGSTYNSIVLKDFTATTFNINGDTYKISGTKFVKK